jgi:hypothetical protein
LLPLGCAAAPNNRKKSNTASASQDGEIKTRKAEYLISEISHTKTLEVRATVTSQPQAGNAKDERSDQESRDTGFTQPLPIPPPVNNATNAFAIGER